MIEKYCANCGKKFETDSKHAYKNFCSVFCNRQDYRRKKKTELKKIKADYFQRVKSDLKKYKQFKLKQAIRQKKYRAESENAEHRRKYYRDRYHKLKDK